MGSPCFKLVALLVLASSCSDDKALVSKPVTVIGPSTPYPYEPLTDPEVEAPPKSEEKTKPTTSEPFFDEYFVLGIEMLNLSNVGTTFNSDLYRQNGDIKPSLRWVFPDSETEEPTAFLMSDSDGDQLWSMESTIDYFPEQDEGSRFVAIPHSMMKTGVLTFHFRAQEIGWFDWTSHLLVDQDFEVSLKPIHVYQLRNRGWTILEDIPIDSNHPGNLAGGVLSIKIQHIPLKTSYQR